MRQFEKRIIISGLLLLLLTLSWAALYDIAAEEADVLDEYAALAVSLLVAAVLLRLLFRKGPS